METGQILLSEAHRALMLHYSKTVGVGPRHLQYVVRLNKSDDVSVCLSAK